MSEVVNTFGGTIACAQGCENVFIGGFAIGMVLTGVVVFFLIKFKVFEGK